MTEPDSKKSRSRRASVPTLMTAQQRESLTSNGPKSKAARKTSLASMLHERRLSLASLASPRFATDDVIAITRPPYTQIAFDEIHTPAQVEKIALSQRIKKECYCSKKRMWKYVSTYIPILKVIRTYNLKEYALIDFLAGLTVGIMHIPQALAFGMLTSVKIENGMYTSFWPVLMYMIFGTSAHVSIGTSAVICILTATVVDRQAEKFIASRGFLNVTINGTFSMLPIEETAEFMDYKENIAMATSLLVGIILLLMGLFRLGFITAYLSESFFSAFTTGAAIHIATSQIPSMLGLRIPKYSGTFKIIKTYSAIFMHITETNFAELSISLCSMAALYLVKECINERFKHKLKVPIPIELLVIIAGTVVSYVANMSDAFGVTIVGHIPSDIPVPAVPDLSEAADIAMDSFIIAILIFANTIAMAKICAKKHNYEVDDCQELISYGMCNFFSAFMFCFPSSIAPPRSMVASSMNCKTQVSGLYAAILMLLVMTVISTLFASLPKAVLGAVIVIALKGLFLQMTHTKKFWHINKFDFVIWMCTFLSVVFLDIDYGLLIGVAVSLVTVVFQTQFARGYTMGKTSPDNVLVDHRKYIDSSEIPGLKLFRFQSSLYFANAEIFRTSIYKETINPRKLLKLLKKEKIKALRKNKGQNNERNGDTNNGHMSFALQENEQSKKLKKTDSNGLDNPVFTIDEDKEVHSNVGEHSIPTVDKLSTRKYSIASFDDNATIEAKFGALRAIHHVIIDCSTINYIDASGANVLSHIFTEYDHVNITLMLAGCSPEMRRTMKNAGTFDVIPQRNMFIDISDAVSIAKAEKMLPLPEELSDFSDEEAAESSYITNL